MSVQDQSQKFERALGLLALGYLFFVVYGSLLPFEFKPMPFTTAWTSFMSIPWLNLGVEQRADWVANLLLYIPLGFLFCACLVGRSRRGAVIFVGLALAWLFGSVVAAGVEFTQLYFPQRTFSLNDLTAEIVGSLLGAVSWPLFGARLMSLVQGVMQGGTKAWRSFLIVYALVYVILALFPYDFLLSETEWQSKWTSGNVAWLIGRDCGFTCALQLVFEALSVLLLGLLAALAYGSDRRLSLISAALIGLFLGVVIESLQLTIATGISHGASIFSRGVGVMLGAGLLRLASHFDWSRTQRWMRYFIVAGALPYLIAVSGFNHWLENDWLSVQQGLDRLPTVHFLPFYYHYFTSETKAVVSLLYQFALYLPVGVAIWLWRWSKSGKRDAGQTLPMFWAGALACIFEAGKLFIASQHPDPTNILIAMVSARSAYALLDLLGKEALSVRPSVVLPSQRDTSRVIPQADTASPARAMQFFGALALCVAVWSAWTHPLGALPAMLALSVLAALLWLRPGWWLACLLALLPLLDFTPWSGRLFWSEFDTVLALILGVMYLRLPLNPRRAAISALGKVTLVAFILSAVIGVWIGVWPLVPLDANAFTRYTSSYNALRAAKALFFALACLPLLRYELRNPHQTAKRMVLGMTLGLAAEVVYVLWERVTFSGLFNFDADFRITGSFPGMHIGGAYIEAYLVLALPFALLLAWQARQLVVTALVAVLYTLGAYCVMVTFSRGGQVAFALVTILAVGGFALRNRAQRWIGVAALSTISIVVFAVAWPIFTGTFSQSRLATIRQDVVTRTDHWSDALQILKQRHETILGAGLGSFPAEFYWGSRVLARPSTYAFQVEKGNEFLRLGSGETLYFEQQVAIDTHQQYILSMRLRSNAQAAVLGAPICEKALLYSFTCNWVTLNLHAPVGQWARYEVKINPSHLGPPGSLFPRPIKLSLFNNHPGSLVDVDDVSLKDAGGRELIVNGDFSAGMAHWFFSTDSHLAWHVKNLFFHVLFEQGFLGLLLFSALVIYAMVRLGRAAWRGDVFGLTLFASLAGFLSVGLVDSLIDETRLGFLFYFLLLTGLMLPKYTEDAQAKH